MFKIKKLRWLLLFWCFSLSAAQWEAGSEEEALFLRRIADFWEEGEYQIVKEQIEEFLRSYPRSAFFQTLCATLGDLYLKERSFKEALLYYSRIEDPETADRVFFNRMQCLLELQWFATLADDCEVFLSKNGLTEDRKVRGSYLLVVALYQQCLNASPESEELEFLAKRAIPHFRFLLETEFSSEVAPAFAHVCCLLKDYGTASKIYMQLAEDHKNEEELLFQAALLQAKADRQNAIHMFQQIEQLESKRAADALYNRLVLMVDLGSYEDVLQDKDKILAQLPKERSACVHLLFGHCHLQLKQYDQAVQELAPYVNDPSGSTEALYSAWIDLMEATYYLGDEAAFDKLFRRFAELFPNDQHLSRAFLAHAILLKAQARFEEAREKLHTLLSSSDGEENRERALFELAQLECQQQRWEACRTASLEFLSHYPLSTLFHQVGRFLATSASYLVFSEETALKEQALSDLEVLLTLEGFDARELHEWRFLLTKAYYDLGRYSRATQMLEEFFLRDLSDVFYADARLLRGLCYRDGDQDLDRFCEEATQALALGSELFERGAVHIALFNAYLENKNIPLAAEHLYLASKSKPLQFEHLHWLTEYYYLESTRSKNYELCQRTTELFEQLLTQNHISLQSLDERHLSFESTFVKLAELAGWMNKETRQLEILEGLKRQREAHPNWAWEQEDLADLLLGECYEKIGREEEAFALFEKIHTRSRSIRSLAAASACLKSARIQIAKLAAQPSSSPLKILTQLKNLVLQRTLINEPIHLEAALEYIDLQTRMEKNAVEKRLALLKKIKSDFEEGEDLLSRDYQQSRKRFPEQDRIYCAYMRLFEAEILLCQSVLTSDLTLRAQAFSILEELLKVPCSSFLKKRVQRHLEIVHDK
jgi:tetratricopeptide (TPR) repeat protein